MNNLGSGVSRVLDPTGTQYLEVILQQGKPPCDAEFNLLQELGTNFTRQLALRGVPSGWLGNETNPRADFLTNPTYSNWLKFGPQRAGEQQAIMWAVVNGWLVPVTGTRTGTPPGSPDDTDTFNVIALDPPPSNSGDFRVDFAFLEVWLARIPPNPATLNKPAASAVYRYGNVEGGNSFVPDDIIDPQLGFETSERVQLQYRIRVADGLVGLTANPDGFDPAVVKAQGAASSATAFVFQNMRSVLGDPGLWRAGDGTINALGTVDGYSYAIPLCAVFRRNSVAWNGDPSQNLNGSLNRNPTAVDRTGIATFTGVPTLALELTGLVGSTTATLVAGTNFPLPANPATPIAIQIDDEVMTYTQVTTGGSPQITGLVRGFAGTRIDDHKPGAVVTILSGRPDGLFADQVASTDVLDLRHLVNPNGFDYQALLKNNLDRLLRGQLRANWKRSGAGPQGPFVFYQDKITASSVSLGVTKLDAFDGIRQVFSDAAAPQRVECIVQANSLGIPAAIGNPPGWSLIIAANHTTRSVLGQFSPGDVITIPVAQLKGTVPGADADQVRWLVDNIPNAVTMRIDGTSVPLPPSAFTVAGSISTNQTFGPNDDMVITLGANFPVVANPKQVYITLNIMYGPGRGLSRRPDSIHSLSFISPATVILSRPQNLPINNRGVSTSWAPLWAKYRGGTFKRNVPVAAEAYADLGSKTVIVSPFRSISMPSNFISMDGYIANPYVTTPITSTGSTTSTTLTDTTQNFNTSGINPGDVLILNSGPQVGRWTILTVGPTTLTVDHVLPTATSVPYSVLHYTALVASSGGSSTGINVLTDISGPNFVTAGVVAGDILIIVNGNGTTRGRYTVQGSPWAPGSAPTSTTITLDRAIPSGTGLQYIVVHSQGLMPLNASNGVSVKWAGTDPLGLFSGTTESSQATNNVYVTLPRHLVPSWGAFYVPILPSDAATTFSEGVNFMSLTTKGSAFVDGDKNYVPYNNVVSYAIFSTLNLQTSAPATYNTQFTFSAKPFAGMRKFNDTRGLGRAGLELPPFYGIARLFAVYEANNYKTAGSAYDPSTRNALGSGAVNLLRQNMGLNDGPTFWVEIDADGDSTFILNANALNLAISPNPITSFASADFVIEASIFGFDRGSFDISREFRLVMTRPTAPATMRNQANDTVVTNRYANNIGVVVAGPTAVLPGPATGSDSLVINYSRTPYQGDAWGSQTNNIDISQFVGPLSSGTAFQIASTKLTESALTRPNTKLLEVLAATSFATTMGTGRISGDVSTLGIDVRDVGYENPASYPPASGVSPRPVTLASNFVTDTVEVGTGYLGASERLPLGALWRDKDFRGGLLGVPGSIAAPVIYFDEAGVGTNPSNLAASTSLVQNEILLDTASTAAGAPGDLIAHVDGEPGNYALLVNFRTYRGGSLFTVGGGHPGGEVAVQLPGLQAPDGHTNVLEGRAYLVRNAVTNVGATEVSPGGELMLLVATNVIQLEDTNVHGGFISIGTNGTGEGYAAADLYRIEGHPMMRDNVRVIVDPTTITLSKRSA